MGEGQEKCSYEGYLSKGGKNLLVQYPKRYFRILGGALFWYKSKEDTSPLGEMLVNDVTEIIVKLKNKDGIPFDVVTAKRSLNLIAPNNEVLDYWLNALGPSIKVTREPEPAEQHAKPEIKRTTTTLFKKNIAQEFKTERVDKPPTAELKKTPDKQPSANPSTPTPTPTPTPTNALAPPSTITPTPSSTPSSSSTPTPTPKPEAPNGTTKIAQNNTEGTKEITEVRPRAGSGGPLPSSSTIQPTTIKSSKSSTNISQASSSSSVASPKPNGTIVKKAAAGFKPNESLVKQPAGSKSPKPLPTLPPGTEGVASPRPLPAPRPKNAAQPQALDSPQPALSHTEETEDNEEPESNEYSGYSTVCYAVVHSNFSGEGEVGTVLELKVGMTIGVVEQGEDGWWLGYPLQTVEPLGYFPGSYVRVMEGEEAAKAMQREDKKKKNSTLSFSVSEKAGASELDPQKRVNTAKEILQTETSYVKFMDILIKHYEQPLTQWIQTNASASVTANDIKNVFLNVSQIYPLNQELLSRLEATMATSNPKIGDVFLQMAPFLKIYNEFGNRYQSAIDTLNKIRLDSTFLACEGDCHNKAGRQNGLENLLIMPVQRIPRYILLLEELLKNTANDQPEHASLQKAIAQVRQVAQSFNESVKKFSNAQRLLSITKGVEQLLAPHRVLIQENTVQSEKRSLNGNSVLQKGTYQMLIFNDILVFAQKGEVTVNYPLDLVWVDASGNLVGTTPLEIGLVVPGATYNIKLLNSNVPARQELMKVIMNAIADYQKKNPPSEPPPFSSDRASTLMPAVRFGKFSIGLDVNYDGWWNWGKFHLSGSYEWHGNSYIGEWDNGLKAGMGTCHFNTGEVYSGSWQSDSPHGKGQYIYLDGDIYVGEWKDGKQYGEGELQYFNENRYKGTWKDGLPHGHGVYTSRVTEKDGTWSAGKMNGYGTERHSKGWLYTGFWSNGKWDGRGVMHYTDNTTYEGTWKEGLRHGTGKLIERTSQSYKSTPTDNSNPNLATGGNEGMVVYEGEWMNDKMEGKGTHHYPGGGVYVGQWRDGKRNGTGTYTLTLADGKYEKYEGEWQADRRQGRGVLTTLGGRFEGTFKDDRYHGLGALTLSDGTTLEGRWLHGNMEGRCIITNRQEDTGKNITTVMITKEKEGIAVFGDNTEIVRPLSLPLLD